MAHWGKLNLGIQMHNLILHWQWNFSWGMMGDSPENTTWDSNLNRTNRSRACIIQIVIRFWFSSASQIAPIPPTPALNKTIALDVAGGMLYGGCSLGQIHVTFAWKGNTKEHLHAVVSKLHKLGNRAQDGIYRSFARLCWWSFRLKHQTWCNCIANCFPTVKSESHKSSFSVCLSNMSWEKCNPSSRGEFSSQMHLMPKCVSMRELHRDMHGLPPDILEVALDLHREIHEVAWHAEVAMEVAPHGIVVVVELVFYAFWLCSMAREATREMWVYFMVVPPRRALQSKHNTGIYLPWILGGGHTSLLPSQTLGCIQSAMCEHSLYLHNTAFAQYAHNLCTVHEFWVNARVPHYEDHDLHNIRGSIFRISCYLISRKRIGYLKYGTPNYHQNGKIWELAAHTTRSGLSSVELLIRSDTMQSHPRLQYHYNGDQSDWPTLTIDYIQLHHLKHMV